MREIRTSGSMSGDGKRGGFVAPTAPILDSTHGCGRAGLKPRPSGGPLRASNRREKSGLGHPGRTVTKCSQEAMTPGVASAHYASLSCSVCQANGNHDVFSRSLGKQGQV